MITLIKTQAEADDFICNEVCNDLNNAAPLKYFEYVKAIVNGLQYDVAIDLPIRYRLKNEDFFYKCLSAIIISYPELNLKLSDDLTQLKLEK